MHSAQDPNAYELTGNTITIRCIRPARPSIVYHQLTWGIPTTRTDNTPLDYDELSHYELETFAGVLNVGLATEYTMGDVGTTQRIYRIRTVLKSGQMSDWSPEVKLGG